MAGCHASGERVAGAVGNPVGGKCAQVQAGVSAAEVHSAKRSPVELDTAQLAPGSLCSVVDRRRLCLTGVDPKIASEAVSIAPAVPDQTCIARLETPDSRCSELSALLHPCPAGTRAATTRPSGFIPPVRHAAASGSEQQAALFQQAFAVRSQGCSQPKSPLAAVASPQGPPPLSWHGLPLHASRRAAHTDQSLLLQSWRPTLRAWRADPALTSKPAAESDLARDDVSDLMLRSGSERRLARRCIHVSREPPTPDTSP
ncbi:hypothetical protein PHYPSEUDO_002300 [Phytophthora pseudosyringae]|uniref:Uncharacterized protein n=1 Tax=Phytophthora pseudosyringae TaxID=221518 RepID=A0A8T1WFC2_9STRA|nr:hypothetical protein PHYPSEUDO_002300 [Phytophthora pseudosyringae]